MSQILLRELDLASTEVDKTISSLFTQKQEPKTLYDASKHLINAGGKRLRPFLTLQACEMVGGRRENALPIAASIELIHNFTLIHDDIMDSDPMRRGVQTVHAIWGVPLAIIAGDMLFAKAYEMAISVSISPKRLSKIIATITHATIRICEGQALDLLFAKDNNVSEKQYVNMVYKKTAILLEAAARLGALVGGGTASEVKKLGNFASYAGHAFQIVDDILGLTAEEKILGKPVGSDLREGKNTIIIIHALAHAEKNQRRQILSVLGKKGVKQDSIEAVIQTIRSIGSIRYAHDRAEFFISKAKTQILTFPPSSSKDILIDLCNYIISRKY